MLFPASGSPRRLNVFFEAKVANAITIRPTLFKRSRGGGVPMSPSLYNAIFVFTKGSCVDAIRERCPEEIHSGRTRDLVRVAFDVVVGLHV